MSLVGTKCRKNIYVIYYLIVIHVEVLPRMWQKHDLQVLDYNIIEVLDDLHVADIRRKQDYILDAVFYNLFYKINRIIYN